jgi:MFS family permease
MSNVARKAALLSSLGAGLEYYDFIIYGMMAEQLGLLFFAGDEPWIALLKTFAVFAIGYIIRPFGGILFGMIGDTFGRKKTFFSVMLLMAISTFSIGLLPTYAQIGSAASLLLIFLRLLQGLSFGAELPGAITVVCEYSEKQKKSTYSGFVISSVSIGSTLASLVLYILTTNIAKEQVLNWGWRLPFLLGGLLAIANYFIRKNLQETPEFSRLQNRRSLVSLKDPISILFRKFRYKIILGIGMTWFVSSLVIFSLYLPTYLSEHYHYVSKDIYLAMTYGLLWSAVSLPFCGQLADRIGKTKILLAVCLAFIAGASMLFGLLHLESFSSLVLFMILYQTTISLLTVSFFPLLADIFPTEARYTGIAMCYNITYSIMGCAPILITALIKYTDSPSAGRWFLLSSACISIVSTMLLAKATKNSQEQTAM